MSEPAQDLRSLRAGLLFCSAARRPIIEAKIAALEDDCTGEVQLATYVYADHEAAPHRLAEPAPPYVEPQPALRIAPATPLDLALAWFERRKIPVESAGTDGKFIVNGKIRTAGSLVDDYQDFCERKKRAGRAA